MSSSNPGEEKKLDNVGNGQNVPTKDEGSALPTFINNWAPLPSAASATSTLNMGSTLNLNLPNFYQGSGGSVISGPPLLGGVLMTSGAPSNTTNSTIPTINSANGRTDFLNMGVHSNTNTAGLTVSQIPLPGSTAGNTHAPEGGQRSHSNSFNGYGYTQHAYSTGLTAPVMSNTGGSLAPSSGLVSNNHIDFMNINSSPPLLSSASSASSGMFLTSLPGKGSDGLGMLNHPNIYSSMHGILPAGSASYTNLSTYRDGALDPPNSAQSSVGIKRPPTAVAQNVNVATAGAASANNSNNAANKRAKAVANRARGASVGANGEGAGFSAGSTLSQTDPNGASLVPQNLAHATSVPPTFDSSVSYNSAQLVAGQNSAPAHMQPRPLPSTLHTQSSQGSAPAPLTSATITYPIISSYKATSVMTTGGAAYMPAAASAVSTLHSAQAGVNTTQLGGNAGMVGMQSAHSMGGNASMGSAPQMNGNYVPDSSSPRPYSYTPAAASGNNNMHMPQLQQQQLSQQHAQTGQGMGYNGSAQGLTYMQQQQHNAYHRQQPLLNSSNPTQGQYNHNNSLGVNGGGQMQMPNYPLNPLSNQNNMNNSMNMQNSMLNNNMQNMQHMQNMQNNMQGGMQNNMLNNTAQQNAANKAAPARARVRNKTPRPGKKALAAAAALGGPGEGGDGTAPGFTGDATNQAAAAPAVKPMTYKEKRAASSKKAMAAAAAAAAAEAERTGEPIAPGLVVPADPRRKDGKRDRDNSLVDGEAGRSEREKAEKEESTTALLKRREPIVQRLEDIEDSKFLGRKGPSFVPPAITSVPTLSGQQVSKMEDEWEAPEGATKLGSQSSQARGLRDEGRRPKTHWDYVLQEVQWMAVDFRQELRWKMAACKHVAEACASSTSRCVLSQRAVKLSPADAAQARATAKALAQRVKAFWQQLSDNVTSSGGHAEELCKLLSNDYSSELFPELDGDNTKPENINKLTDKILTLPSMIRSSSTGSSLEEASSSTPIEKSKSAYFHATTSAISCVGNTPITLLAHQQAALQQVNALNAEKFGAVLYGKAYIGKTTTGCELIKEWLARRYEAACTPLVLVVAERRCVFRWATELRSQQCHQVEVWSAGASTETSAEAKVLIVASELLNAFLSSPRFKEMASSDIVPQNMAMDVDGVPAAARTVLQGVIVDRRCIPEKSAPSSSALAPRSSLDVLGELAARLDRRLTQRCLIAEDTFLPGSVLEALSFLSPGTHVRDWDAKYPAGPNSAEETTENHQEQIVRNTLNQLLANLSVAVKLPGNADSVIAAQTRVEVVAPEMDNVQARLYHTVMSHLARHPTICSGENTTKLAAALVLLQKVCFHAALVTHKGQGVVPSRYIGSLGGAETRYDDNIQQRSELDTPEMQLSGGVAGLSTRPSLTNMGSPYATATLPLRTPSSYDLYWTGGSGVRGSTDASPVPSEYIYSESSFSRGVLSARLAAASESVDTLDQGSCKLQGLRRLLRRFAGLRVAVLIETQDEYLLVKQLLEALKIQHEVAFAPTSSKASIKDNGLASAQESRLSSAQSADQWVASQKAVQVFNSPLNDTCVLLCSKHVFQPPNVPPQQADAVVILSDDWTSTTEVRDCFRLRLLSAGPTGPPLTVVRVAAGGTIEERMARKGGSLLQLQGTPMSQLWPGAKSPLSLTAIPSSLATGSAEPTLLSKAPVLVLPTAPKSQVNAISPFPGSETDSSRTGSDRSGSPMVLSSESDASKRNSDSSLRGKGKGFIVLGKQGSTTFVKDQGTQGLGLSRGRSGVLPGLSGSSADPLRQPEAQSWFRRLHRDLAQLSRDFDSRAVAVVISTIGDLVVSSEEAPTTLLTVSAHEEKVHEHEGANINIQPTMEMEVEDSTLSKIEIEALLGRVFDQFVLSQATAATFGADTSMTTRALRNRLLRILEEQFVERISDKQNAPEVRTFDGVPLPLEPVSSFSQLELQRLIASGLGRSAEEDALSQLMLPFQYDSLLPLDSNKVKAEVDASQHWPQSFLVFRDVLAESRRLGVSVDHVLYVNPLQTACRGESIAANAFQRTSLPLDATISIKYLAEGARSAAGANRSKSRRSRPSGGASRRKDSVTSLTNPAENAESTSAAPAQSADGLEVKIQPGGNDATFEGFLSDLEPSGDTPQKAVGQQRSALPVVSPVKSPNPVQEMTSLDSWHPTEDDIIICTQNAFSDTHFKRTENWLNRALEQSRRRRRTAAEARLRYTWLCTTGRTQQRLQDPLVVAQIEQLRFSVQQRVAAAAAASAANAAAGVAGQGSQPPSPFVAGINAGMEGVGDAGQLLNSADAPLVHETPTKPNHNQPDSASGAPF